MIKSLQTAIFARYNSASGDTLRGLTAGLWEDEAPSSIVLQTQTGGELKNQPLPFITFTLVTTGLEQNFCDNFYSPLVQFSIHGGANNKSSSDLLDVERELLVVFGDELLTMDNGYTMIRNDTIDQRKFKDEEKMWNVMVDFEYIVEKDRV